MSFADAFSNAFKGRKEPQQPDNAPTPPTQIPGTLAAEAMRRAIMKQKSSSQSASRPASGATPLSVSSVATVEKIPPRDPDYLNKVKQLVSFKVVAVNERSQVAEEFRILRTNIQALDLPQKSILFTSSHHSEGKTTTVLHLALYMAKNTDKRILLIDADLRRPKIAKYLHLRPRMDFADALKGADLKDCLIYSREQNLTVLPAKRQYSNATELFEKQRFKEIMDEARREFDFILVDTCPVLCAADPCIIGAETGGCVLVIKTRATQRESINSSCEKMDSSGIPVRGIILTHVKLFVPKYLYRYQYYRGYYYYEDSQ